eukprot:577003-Pelagomonas_calceolata.AAC.3
MSCTSSPAMPAIHSDFPDNNRLIALLYCPQTTKYLIPLPQGAKKNCRIPSPQSAIAPHCPATAGHRAPAPPPQPTKRLTFHLSKRQCCLIATPLQGTKLLYLFPKQQLAPESKHAANLGRMLEFGMEIRQASKPVSASMAYTGTQLTYDVIMAKGVRGLDGVHAAVLLLQLWQSSLCMRKLPIVRLRQSLVFDLCTRVAIDMTTAQKAVAWCMHARGVAWPKRTFV